MPTARFASGAVSIPGLGVLVVGGSVSEGWSSRSLRNAEILHFGEISGKNKPSWITIDPILTPRCLVCAAYCNDSVIVSNDGEETIEMLSLPSGQPGQWTLISTGGGEDRLPHCLCVFKGLIYVSSKLTTIDLM